MLGAGQYIPLGVMNGWSLVLALTLIAATLLTVACTRRLVLSKLPLRQMACDGTAVFLLENGELIDATPKAADLLHRIGGRQPVTERLIAALGPALPGLADALANTAYTGRLHVPAAPKVPSSGNAATLAGAQICETIGGLILQAEVEHHNGRTRLSLIEHDTAGAPHSLAITVMDEELSVLRQASTESKELVWAQTGDGQIIWANTAYLALADALDHVDAGTGDTPQAPRWPPRVLFPEVAETAHRGHAGPGGKAGASSVRRAKIALPGSKADTSFDIRVSQHVNRTLFVATDTGALVAAVEKSRLFMQSLANTFAHLSIGLAIFDRNLRLTTFNPALLDLTGLDAGFLATRPALVAVMDRLRDTGVMQEPRDYTGWKERLTTTVSAARNGTFSETWTLPGGEIFRVTGRPHPDGGVAFLFEDISAEVSLTRNFRAEMEATQAVLNGLQAAIVVFSAAGTLTSSNLAFERLWAPKPIDGSLDPLSFNKALAHWRMIAEPTPFWVQLRRFAVMQGARAPISVGLSLADGRTSMCRAQPLPGGATMVVFSEPDAAPRRKQPEPKPSAQKRAGQLTSQSDPV